MSSECLSHIKRASALAALVILASGLWVTPRAQAQFTYLIDDGTAENSVGLSGAVGGTFVALNSFATGSNNTIISIAIAFGDTVSPDPFLNGLTYTAALYSDPNGDGLPSDAVLLATAPGVIAGAGTNTFVTSVIDPTMVLTPNFFVGLLITHAADQRPVAFDQTAPSLAGRSFISFPGDLNDVSAAGPIEDFVGPGNWLIRANAIPEPSTYALLGLGLVGAVLRSRRARR